MVPMLKLNGTNETTLNATINGTSVKYSLIISPHKNINGISVKYSLVISLYININAISIKYWLSPSVRINFFNELAQWASSCKTQLAPINFSLPTEMCYILLKTSLKICLLHMCHWGCLWTFVLILFVYVIFTVLRVFLTQ